MNTNHSTGPTSPAGKAVSRFNALKHGLDAKSLTLPGEDPDLAPSISREYHDAYRPDGPAECALVDTLVECRVFSLRYSRVESEYAAHAIAELGDHPYPLGAIYANPVHERVLDRITRHREQANRAWFRAFHELIRIQQARAEREALYPAPPVAAADAADEPLPRPDTPVRSADPDLPASHPHAAAPDPALPEFAEAAAM